ncbi:DNA-directed RNA polymerase subunit alpha C-terminal domain-containing protein [Sphingobacterium sp. BS-2]|uniref:DNA-directed RNA polymerase subunit alpha C-terminal domain-containing protein n=1 Tax=Sphingobacterium sp. BS-2 TaxID=3377129 RepID=UPI0038FBEA68
MNSSEILSKLKELQARGEHMVSISELLDFIHRRNEEQLYGVDLSNGRFSLDPQLVTLLNDHGINTVGDLCSKSISDLLRIKSFGKRRCYQIYDFLRQVDLKLAP